jgi:hypothetical protein
MLFLVNLSLASTKLTSAALRSHMSMAMSSISTTTSNTIIKTKTTGASGEGRN